MIVRRRTTERRARSRGFSLVELMAVVAIIGVLATLGIAALGRSARQSNVAGATVVVKSIAAAEEQYRAVNQVYLNVSNEDTWYPAALLPPNTKRNFWRDDDAETARWKMLGPDIRQPVDFVFMANAGLPTDSFPEIPNGALALPDASIEPWYLIQAKADADADDTLCVVVVASWSREVFVANDGE